MRFTAVFTSLFLAASALAIPLNSNVPHPCRRGFTILTILTAAPAGKTLELAKREAAPIAEVFVTEKRQLSDITDALDDLLDPLLDLLPTITTTASNADIQVKGLLSGATSDVEGTLSSILVELESVISQLDAAANGVDLTGTQSSISSEVASTITAVQGLLNDAQALAGIVSVSATLTQIITTAESIVNTLTGLTTSSKS